jgi:hypothetical protein
MVYAMTNVLKVSLLAGLCSNLLAQGLCSATPKDQHPYTLAHSFKDLPNYPTRVKTRVLLLTVLAGINVKNASVVRAL